jgi:hypothetical protein
MIRSSACQRQADPFPALSGRHGDCRSYTNPWDIIRPRAARAFSGSPDEVLTRKVEQLANLRSERRKYASGIYRIQQDRLAGILASIDRDIAAAIKDIETIERTETK